MSTLTKRINTESVDSLETLVRKTFDELGFPYRNWGKNAASRPFSEFIDDLGKNRVAWDENHPDVIQKDVAVLHITYESVGKRFELRESVQIFKHNSYRHRNTLDGSLGETILHGESALIAAHRGLEKLSQTEPRLRDVSPNDIHGLERVFEKPFPSSSYPPLQESLNRKKYSYNMPDHLYHPKYVFEEYNKTTYFEWVEVKS